jgi:2-keto-3-deoxy-L-rhamnonate aldolase RhmA
MIENKVKSALTRGETVIGCQVAEVRSPNICQMYATAGFDFIFIDMEHGSFNMETVADFIATSKVAGIVPIVRVPAMEEHFIGRVLDAGAGGILVPHVQNKDQAKTAIKYAKFRPMGERGLAPLRAHTDFKKVDVSRFIKEANDNTMVGIMVEDDEAIKNIESLASTEGVDVIFMGTMDLSYSLDIPGEVRHPEVIKRIDRVLEVCEQNNVAFGMPISDPKWHKKGIRFLFAASDIGLIVDGGARVVKEFKLISQS